MLLFLLFLLLRGPVLFSPPFSFACTRGALPRALHAAPACRQAKAAGFLCVCEMGWGTGRLRLPLAYLAWLRCWLLDDALHADMASGSRRRAGLGRAAPGCVRRRHPKVIPFFFFCLVRFGNAIAGLQVATRCGRSPPRAPHHACAKTGPRGAERTAHGAHVGRAAGRRRAGRTGVSCMPGVALQEASRDHAGDARREARGARGAKGEGHSGGC